MNTISADPKDEAADIRRQVEAHCQALVDAGHARWRVNDQGLAELHLAGGEAYLLEEYGVTRLK